MEIFNKARELAGESSKENIFCLSPRFTRTQMNIAVKRYAKLARGYHKLNSNSQEIQNLNVAMSDMLSNIKDWITRDSSPTWVGLYLSKNKIIFGINNDSHYGESHLKYEEGYWANKNKLTFDGKTKGSSLLDKVITDEKNNLVVGVINLE